MSFVQNIIRLNNRTESEWDFKEHASGNINVYHRKHSNKFQVSVDEFLSWYKKYTLTRIQSRGEQGA